MKYKNDSSDTATCILTTLFLCLFFSTNPLSAETPKRPLPDVPGWTGAVAQTRTLTSAEQEEGQMTERTYRKTDQPERIRVILLEGPGTAWLSFPKNCTEGKDGPVGTGATYITLEFSGKAAVLEHHPVLGYSLAVKLGPETTLTIETKAGKTLLLDFSERLLQLITD
ncbi:MAG: hypothetical protein ACP5CD_01225 [Thermovirgaceae bacterium]